MTHNSLKTSDEKEILVDDYDPHAKTKKKMNKMPLTVARNEKCLLLPGTIIEKVFIFTEKLIIFTEKLNKLLDFYGVDKRFMLFIIIWMIPFLYMIITNSSCISYICYKLGICEKYFEWEYSCHYTGCLDPPFHHTCGCRFGQWDKRYYYI